MKPTRKQWVKTLRAIFEHEGGRSVTVEPTNGNHLRVAGTFGDKQHSVVCSMSPSDARCIYRIRTDLRRLLAGLEPGTNKRGH